MTCKILGLGTATPTHQMSQEEALELFTNIACEEEKHARLARALFRKANVENRHTVVPHRVAYDWCEIAAAVAEEQVTESGVDVKRLGNHVAGAAVQTPSVDAGKSPGPTTQERMELYAAFASDLAMDAATLALAQSNVPSEQITHLVVVTCTGFDSPGVDIELIERLQLSPSTQRIQVGFMGCHAAINGLRTAQAITQSDPNAKVLMCCVELCSLHYRFTWDSEGIIGNALFADGAAAMVLAGSGGGEAAGAVNEYPSSDETAALDWRVVQTGSMVIPNSRDAMSWKIGDHGFEMKLTGEVGEKIEEHLAEWLSGWLQAQGLGLNDVDYWGVHPGGPRILTAVETCLNLAPEHLETSRAILKQNGNMSSPTVLFILEQFRKQQAKKVTGPQDASGNERGKYCILLGFGPGLVAEIALLRCE